MDRSVDTARERTGLEDMALDVPLFAPSMGRRVLSGADHRLVVSVIINNYNYGRFLRTAVDSALGQTYPDVQVIVVDDGSTDDSRDVMEFYGDSIVSIVKENAGQASAFNAGMAECKGHIVIFLDSDDALLPETAEQVVHAFVTHDHVAKVQYRMEIIDADNNRTGVIKPSLHLPMRSGDLRRQILMFPEDIVRMPTSGNAFHAAVLGVIFPMPEEEFRILADEYVRQLAPLYGGVVSLDYVGALYRMHGSNNYEGNEWDLARIQKELVHMACTHAAIALHADVLHLRQFMPDNGEILSVSFVAHRLVSLRLDPTSHPISGDRVLPLYRLGLTAISRRFDITPMMKAFYILWFTGVAFGPRFVVMWLAVRWFFPESRVPLNRLLAVLHRG